MRSFIKYRGRSGLTETVKPHCSVLCLNRREPQKGETISGKARYRERSDRRIWPRNRLDSDATLHRLCDEVDARIGNRWRSGIGNEGDALASLQTPDQC